MDRDNARDTRAPSNRDVRLRRRTGLGGALVTGRALRRRSLNALSTRARHVHRHRQSSFAPSSSPFIIPHHPSRGYAGPVAIARSIRRPRPPSTSPRARPRREPRETLKKIYFPASIVPRRHPHARVVPRARDRRAPPPPPRATPRARAFHPSRRAFVLARVGRTRFGPAPLFTMVNAPRETREEEDVALVVIFVPTTAEVMVSPCIVGKSCVGVCGTARRGGSRDARGHPRVVTQERESARASDDDDPRVRDGCAWGLCIERERRILYDRIPSLIETRLDSLSLSRARARCVRAPCTSSHDR